MGQEVGVFVVLFLFLNIIHIYIHLFGYTLKRLLATDEVKMEWQSVGVRRMQFGRVRVLTREVFSQARYETRFVWLTPRVKYFRDMCFPRKYYGGPFTKGVPVYSHTELEFRFY